MNEKLLGRMKIEATPTIELKYFCRSTPARHAANPFLRQRHPKAQLET